MNPSGPEVHRNPRLGTGDPGPGAVDAVLLGGKVYGGRDSDGRAVFHDGLALRDGRIARVGSTQDLQPLLRTEIAEVDLGGRTVIPGLIDSHTHLVRQGLTWKDETRWDEVPSLEEAYRRLDREAERRPAGEWIRVIGGWHPGQFEENRLPTLEELSRRYPDHPVYIQFLYEQALLNQKGLEACGITRNAEDPPMGSFERDSVTGEPTGTVSGMGTFQHCSDRFPELSHEKQVEGTREFMQRLNSWGITGVVDAGGFGMSPDRYGPLLSLWKTGRMTVRTRLLVHPPSPGNELEALRGWLNHLEPGLGDPWLRYTGIGEFLAWGCHDGEGVEPHEIGEDARQMLERIAREMARRRWPLHIHAILDDSADAILDVFERVDRDHSIADLRWSFVHADEFSNRTLDRMAELNVGATLQNRLVYRATDSAELWGEEAVREAPPIDAMRARDIPIGAGTDATAVASPNPWVSLWWFVTGRTYDDGPKRHPRHCMDRAEALDAFTTGSAWFTFEEEQRGRLVEGMRADLAVLSDDYFTVPEDELSDIQSDLTLVDGRVVHARDPYAELTDRFD